MFRGFLVKKKDTPSPSFQNEPKWPCQSPGQKTTPRKAVSSRDFKRQYKVYLKSRDCHLGCSDYCLPIWRVLPSVFCPLPFNKLHSSSALLSECLIWILLTKITWIEDLVRLDCSPFYVNSILEKMVASVCVLSWETPVYRQPLTPVWVQMQGQNASVSWLACEYHCMSNTTHETEHDT